MLIIRWQIQDVSLLAAKAHRLELDHLLNPAFIFPFNVLQKGIRDYSPQ